ncbi:hypothetical protein SYK_19390 [Pseudodesulfovibrio nedwellii]|uniref:Solute-binding protein family 3/N-terminal domain-containing protein n=1 Tax=Pseudodesulfovibrio nedwellii TaxID=2973072 RepID=A0ABM8B180_9BACT|nr:hypothetical protein [Pseudodesulfovibrio nedwellii]BDQ37579.1 hypothetical protein SYK_19390 [Pseudodesulfovibrio nedwellii]
MHFPRIFIIILILVSFTTTPHTAHADYLTIRVPAYSDGIHSYFVDLLTTALSKAGHLAAIEQVSDIPHLRERTMLETGELSVLWLVRSQKRDKRYFPVPVKLTNGMIGKRVLLVPRDQKEDYKDVKTLRDFKELGKIGGFGTQWFDVGVWKANDLPYLEVTQWRLLYRMVADESRGVDYFSRGINEVMDEVENHSELVIEPHIMLVYNRDFIFYVSPTRPQLAETLRSALEEARDSGLVDQLIKKHWGKTFELLQPETRTIIPLHSPQ